MGDHQHTVEINGKRIDAVTGHAVSHPQKKVITVHDGSLPRVADKPAHSKKGTAHAVHRKQTRAKTLMRSAVKKPQIMATAAPIDQEIEEFSARKALEELRLHRAKKVPTSRLVSRFGIPEITTTRITPKHTDIPVKPAPVHSQSATKQHHATKAAPKTHHDHFAAQLEKATAHTSKPLKKHHKATAKHRRHATVASASMAVLAVLVLGGYMAYQNSAVLAARVAATQAGLSVNVPRYTPAGFRLKGHSLEPGTISLNYGSNTDGRTYRITQEQTALDSTELLETAVASNEYQTLSSKGREVFIYNGNTATWVDNGKLYKVEGNAQLSSQQLQQLVDSI